MSAVLLLLGLGLGALGTAVAVGAAAASRLELSRWVAERRRGVEIATALLSAPGPVIGTAAGLATLGAVVAAAGLAPLLADLPGLPGRAAGALLAVVLIVLIVGVLPRAAGRRWAEPLVRAASPWLGRAAHAIAPFLPGAPPDAGADLAGVVRRGEGDDVTEGEIAVISGVLAFTERPVREAMTPRTEIVALAEGVPADEAATLFAESGYSRLPVYRDSLDNVVGLVHAFDLLRTEPGQAFPLRPVAQVPGSRRCADLLFEMQRERRQFAVVLDEFGGTAGIITFEDLLEELVGEIFDEGDGPPGGEPAGIRLLELSGATPMDEVADAFDVTFAEQAETVGGLLAGTLGRIPHRGERILLAGLEFDVIAATPTRVDRVIVRQVPAAPVLAPGSRRTLP